MRGHMRRAAQVSVSGAAWLGFALRRCSQRPGVSGALSPRSPWTGQLRSRARSLPHRACPRPWRPGWTRWIQPGQHQRPEPHSGLCSRSSPTALRAPAPAPQATLLGPTAPLLPGEPAGAIKDFRPLLAPQPPPPPGGQRTSEARGKQQKRAPVCSQGSLSPPRGAVTPRGGADATPSHLPWERRTRAKPRAWPPPRSRGAAAGQTAGARPAVPGLPGASARRGEAASAGRLSPTRLRPAGRARGDTEQHRVPCPGSPAVGPWPAALAAPPSSSVPLPGRWLQPAPLRSGPAGQLRPLQGGTRNPGSQRLSAGWGGRGGQGGRA